MIAAGIVQAVLGIEAARRDLEDIAKPLSAEAARGRGRERARRSGRRRGGGRASARASPARPTRRLQQSSSRVPDEDIDEEVAALVDALREAGGEGLDRRALGDRVNCRLWGPGRFRHALATANGARGDPALGPRALRARGGGAGAVTPG